MHINQHVCHNPLLDRCKHSLLKNITLLLLFSLSLGAISQVSIPLLPVPITLQTAGVIAIGALLGPRLGTLTVVAYLVEGLLGLPMFANAQAGIAVLLGPSGGYLLGFLPAAFISGYCLQQGWARNIFLTLLAVALADMVIFACGFMVLANYTGWHQAFTYGTQPFLLTEPIKLIFVAYLGQKFWR